MKQALRVNTLKISAEKLVKRLTARGVTLEKIPFLHHGYWYQAEFSLGATPEYLQGLYYLQEAASQKVVEILNPQLNDIVLDMAAAPGSKTTHLAMNMKNQGVIVALDNNTHRIPSLKNNLERCGVSNCLVYQKDARYVTDLKVAFDKVLLDAPCSGNSGINPDYALQRSPEDIKSCQRMQVPLLHAGLDVLKNGGILVYSTCSEQVQENEDVIKKVLEQRDDIQQEGPFTKYLVSEETQGFFIAKLRKKA